MYGRADDDTLKGFGRSDALLGQEGVDRLRGEGAIDGYFFERSKWGQDDIVEDSPSRNFLALQFGENITGPVVTNLTSGPTDEVTNAQSGSTVNWEGNVIAFVACSSGDDTIAGNDAVNDIFDDAGPFTETDPDTDDITGAGGNGSIVVEQGDSNDTVDRGEGNDTVYFDDGEELRVTNCEEQNPEEPPFSEARAVESAPGGDLSAFRSFQNRR